MILFIEDPRMIPVMMNALECPPFDIMNLSSYYSGYIDVTNLIAGINVINDSGFPMNEFVNSVNFDMKYAAAIENDPGKYASLLNIVIKSFEGHAVFILVHRDPYRDAVMESLIKYIQQKYGHKCWIINDMEDIECVKEDSFSPDGIMRLDADKEQYYKLYCQGLVGNILPTIAME